MQPDERRGPSPPGIAQLTQEHGSYLSPYGRLRWVPEWRSSGCARAFHDGKMVPRVADTPNTCYLRWFLASLLLNLFSAAASWPPEKGRENAKEAVFSASRTVRVE